MIVVGTYRRWPFLVDDSLMEKLTKRQGREYAIMYNMIGAGMIAVSVFELVVRSYGYPHPNEELASVLKHSVCDRVPLSPARRSDNSMSMKLRHSVALALVGWCPMIPPRTVDTFLPNAPLSQWHRLRKGRIREQGGMHQRAKWQAFFKDPAIFSTGSVRMKVSKTEIHYLASVMDLNRVSVGIGE